MIWVYVVLYLFLFLSSLYYSFSLVSFLVVPTLSLLIPYLPFCRFFRLVHVYVRWGVQVGFLSNVWLLLKALGSYWKDRWLRLWGNEIMEDVLFVEIKVDVKIFVFGWWTSLVVLQGGVCVYLVGDNCGANCIEPVVMCSSLVLGLWVFMSSLVVLA